MKYLIKVGKLANEIFNPVVDYHYNTIGSNSGNLAFAYAVQNTLSIPGSTFIPTRNVHDVDKNNSLRTINNFDAFILPMANSFRKAYMNELVKLTKLIKSCDIPVVVIGIGIQSDLKQNEAQIGSKEIIKNFVSAVLEKSISIGVRGQITKDFICSLGFDNSRIDVIGCPSLNANGRTFTVDKDVFLCKDSIYAYNFSHNMDLRLKNIFANFLNIYKNYTYIAQGKRELGAILLGKDNKTMKSDHLMVNSPNSHLILQNKCVQFLHYPSWLNYIKKFSFTVGTRMHGVISSILAGVPALLVVHDSRTLELARFHKIPHVTYDCLNSFVDLECAISKLDFSKFNTNLSNTFDNFINFLHKNGLKTIYDNGDLQRNFREFGINQTISPLMHRSVDNATNTLSSYFNLVTFSKDWMKKNPGYLPF